MKLTNKYGLDSWLVNLLTDSIQPPNRDVFRVTELIDSPLIKNLRVKYWDDITIDVSDLMQTVYGDAVHDYMHRSASDLTTDKEQEVINVFTDTMVKGHFDRFEDGILKDFKTTGVGYLNIEDNVKKWTKQLNIYAYLIGTYDTEVKGLEIHVLYRNWSKMKLKSDSEYPKIPYQKLALELWSTEKQKKFIEDQIQYHINSPMVCSDKDRWKKETTYAVKNGGAKRALRVLSSQQEAEQWMNKNGRGTHIEVREGEYTRCDNFCELKEFCPYYQN
jgi:hypothetical protein